MNFLFVCHTCVGHLGKSSVRLEKNFFLMVNKGSRGAQRPPGADAYSPDRADYSRSGKAFWLMPIM